MTRWALLAAVVVAVGLLLAGCGGVGNAKPKVYTSPEAPTVPLPKGPHFQGRGSRTIGTIVVRKRSVLRWASDGPIFQLWDKGRRIRVRTQEHGGSLKLEPGTYRAVAVLSVGDWAFTITPG